MKYRITLLICLTILSGTGTANATDDINAHASELAAIIAEQAPMKTSATSTLIGAASFENSVTVMTMLSYDRAYLTKVLKENGTTLDALKQTRREQEQNYICSNADTRSFIDDGGSYTADYTLADGTSFLKVTVDSC